MKPEHDARRTIIREWMSLPPDKRQTEEQAAAFVAESTEKWGKVIRAANIKVE